MNARRFTAGLLGAAMAMSSMYAALGTLTAFAAPSAVIYDDFNAGFSTNKWTVTATNSRGTTTVSNGQFLVRADGRGSDTDNNGVTVVSLPTVDQGVSFDVAGDFGGSYNFGYFDVTDSADNLIRIQLNRNWDQPTNMVMVGTNGYTELSNSAPNETLNVLYNENAMMNFRIINENSEIRVYKDSTLLARYAGSIKPNSFFRIYAWSASAPDRYSFLTLDNVKFYSNTASSSSSSVSSSSSSSSSSVAPVPAMEFLLPDFPSNGRVAEGDWVKAEIKNGIGRSRFYIDVIYDNNQIVYSKDFVETDANGNVSTKFQMPYKLLKSGKTEDGLIIRLSHGDIAYTRAFTLVQGLTITVPQEIKEGTYFTYEVKNSAGNTLVEAGINYDGGSPPPFPNKNTDGSGYAKITAKMPKLIKTNATRDGAEFWVKTKDVTWYFPFTIVKNTTPVAGSATVKKIISTQNTLTYPLPVGGPSTPLKVTLNTTAPPGIRSLFDRSDKTLVVITYGSNQTFDEGNGMDAIYNYLRGQLKYVVRYKIGANPTYSGNELNQWYAKDLNQNIYDMHAVLQSLPNINSIVFVGYSWGANGSNVLASEVNKSSTHGSINILGMAYLDAIAWNADPLTDVFSGVTKLLNIYQGSGPADLHGTAISRNGLTVSNFDIDAYQYFGDVRHTAIHQNSLAKGLIEGYVKTLVNQAFPN